MQKVRANCAKSSQAMCFCMSLPTQLQASLASANVILNWTQTQELLCKSLWNRKRLKNAQSIEHVVNDIKLL
jgi:hypothetical protein